jgi:probable rRNA maturation factor
MSKLNLSIRAGRYTAHARFLRRHLIAAHAMLAPPLNELSLALIGDRAMSQLHERYLNIAGPTDVLTFPLDADRRGRPISGEVVICVPEARRRAAEIRIPLSHELLLYAVHGLLHLCGFDDRTARGYGAMHRMEDRLLTALTIGAVFDVSRAKMPRNPKKC